MTAWRIPLQHQSGWEFYGEFMSSSVSLAQVRLINYRASSFLLMARSESAELYNQRLIATEWLQSTPEGCLWFHENYGVMKNRTPCLLHSIQAI